MKKKSNTLKLNCQIEQIKTILFGFCKIAGKKNCTKNVQPFSNIFFFFYKQIKKKLGWNVWKPSTPIFICLYFIGVGGDENLKNRLVWPKLMIFIIYTMIDIPYRARQLF